VNTYQWNVFDRCSHCRDLAPTWETLAEVMSAVAEHLVDQQEHDYSVEEYEAAKNVQLPVMVAKVDCVTHLAFCQENMIMAYPTLRLFVDGKRWTGGDYNGHRTVLDMVEYLKAIEDTHKTEAEKESPRNLELAHEGTIETYSFWYMLKNDWGCINF
jgi:Thioredoxin